MDLVERLERLRSPGRDERWDLQQLLALAREAVRRWDQAREELGLRGYLGDAVLAIDPDWRECDVIAAKLEAALGFWASRFPICFVKWQSNPRTNPFPNPFEPLIEIVEHGGQVHRDHAGFLEMFSAAGEKAALSLHRTQGT